MVYVGISFDYDSPAGYRESFNMKNTPLDSDEKGTEALLKVLTTHQVKVTFGVVGHAALAGMPPEFCPDQIKRIHKAGHEIASHSMTHRYLPSMNHSEMFKEFQLSKDVLENCIGARVLGFIPPFNRPMHFPSRGAFSLEETFGLNKRGRGRQSIETMLRGLKRSGYSWSRVSFQSKIKQLLNKIGKQSEPELIQPFICEGIVAIPLHLTGFSNISIDLIRNIKNSDKTKFVTIYGHPNQALLNNEQSADELDRMLSCFRKERERGVLEFGSLGDIEKMLRRGCNDR